MQRNAFPLHTLIVVVFEHRNESEDSVRKLPAFVGSAITIKLYPKPGNASHIELAGNHFARRISCQKHALGM